MCIVKVQRRVTFKLIITLQALTSQKEIWAHGAEIDRYPYCLLHQL